MSGDVIDQLAGIEPGSALDVLRARRPDAREYAQASYEALFCPENDEGVTLLERDAIAARVAELHQDAGAAAFYRERLEELAPGGVEPDERLAAGLAHAELLVLRPSEASPQALKALDDAGWSTTEIVTLSQLVAFLTFQIRLVAGLRSLAS
ncbi:CMD domain-containing protein [Nonomuraea sp. NPDC050556]|uniref:CMD domain-containing protein n=1 Tax=Nonomuraea sp. NPDC050556 TaxID=3364369 RepID=UPI0037983081